MSSFVFTCQIQYELLTEGMRDDDTSQSDGRPSCTWRMVGGWGVVAKPLLQIISRSTQTILPLWLPTGTSLATDIPKNSKGFPETSKQILARDLAGYITGSYLKLVVSALKRPMLIHDLTRG